MMQWNDDIGTGAVRQKMHYNVWWAADDNNDVEMHVMLLMDAGDAEVEEEELDGVVDQSTEHEFSFKEFVMRWEFTFFLFSTPIGISLGITKSDLLQARCPVHCPTKQHSK